MPLSSLKLAPDELLSLSSSSGAVDLSLSGTYHPRNFLVDTVPGVWLSGRVVKTNILIASPGNPLGFSQHRGRGLL